MERELQHDQDVIEREQLYLDALRERDDERKKREQAERERDEERRQREDAEREREEAERQRDEERRQREEADEAFRSLQVEYDLLRLESSIINLLLRIKLIFEIPSDLFFCT